MKNTQNVLLCVDSAQGIASLGIVQDQLVLAERQLANKRDHAERIVDEIDALLDQTALKLSDCSAVVIGLGPGSFIGVRIGLATIKGLAFATNIPVIGVSSSAALALSAQQAGRVLVAVDAKKSQVYASAYQVDVDGIIVDELISPQPLAPEQANSLFVEMGPIDVVTGDGFERYKDVFAPILQAGHKPAVFNQGIHAQALAQLAQAKLRAKDYADLDKLAPHYARRSEAEIKRAQRLQKATNETDNL